MHDYGMSWSEWHNTVEFKLRASVAFIREYGSTTRGAHFCSAEYLDWLGRYNIVLISRDPGVSADEVIASMPDVETAIDRLLTTDNSCISHHIHIAEFNACE